MSAGNDQVLAAKGVLKVIVVRPTTIGASPSWAVWNTEHGCYVNASGQLRSGHAADITFASLADAEAAVERYA